MENLLSVTTSAHQSQSPQIIAVSDISRPTKIAEMITHAICAAQVVELRAEGAGGIHQAVRAIALARQNLDSNSLDIACTPVFIGTDRTIVCFHIEPRAKP